MNATEQGPDGGDTLITRGMHDCAQSLDVCHDQWNTKDMHVVGEKEGTACVHSWFLHSIVKLHSDKKRQGSNNRFVTQREPNRVH